MEAIILAGGLGTRLRSVVPELPKCMAPVAGRPFIDHVLRYLTGQGITSIILAVGYRSEEIIDHMNKNYRHLDIRYSLEEEPLGTGGAIRKACKMVHSEQVLVTNGDTIYKVDLASVNTDFPGDYDCILMLKPMTNFDRYGVVSIDESGAVTAFNEKRHYDAGLINGGMYILNSCSFLDESFPDKFSFEKDYLEALYLKRGMYGLVQDAYFIDIGIPEDFARAQRELA